MDKGLENELAESAPYESPKSQLKFKRICIQWIIGEIRSCHKDRCTNPLERPATSRLSRMTGFLVNRRDDEMIDA